VAYRWVRLARSNSKCTFQERFFGSSLTPFRLLRSPSGTSATPSRKIAVNSRYRAPRYEAASRISSSAKRNRPLRNPVSTSRIPSSNSQLRRCSS
jgi:hypothetical protein